MEMRIIDEKFGLKFALSQAQKEIIELRNVGDLQKSAQMKRTEHKLLVDRANSPFGALIPNINEDIEKMDREATEAEKTAADAFDKREKLKEKIADLESKLKTTQINVDVADIVEVQKRKSEIDGLILKIRKTIEAEELKIGCVEIDDTHPLRLLIAQRESILANIALGEKVSERIIESLADKIANEEKLYSDLVASATNIRHGINGLKAKLAELEQELSRVDRYHTEMVMAFLGQEIHIFGKEYSSLALKLSEVFVKIAALESILKGHGSPLKALPVKFSIPALNFPQSQPVGEAEKTADYLFRYTDIDMRKELQAILKTYEGKGIVVPVKN